jgi:hypothetical protein
MTTTVEIPGGTATLRAPEDLTARHTRPLKSVMLALGPERFAEAASSDAVKAAQAAGNNPAAGMALIAELDLTEDEASLLEKVNDAIVWKWLANWTIPRPLPTSIDEILDWPDTLRDALVEATAPVEAAHQAAEANDRFGVAAVEDPQSPTGASAD